MSEIICEVNIIEDVINKQFNKYKTALQDEAELIFYEDEASLHGSMEKVKKKSIKKHMNMR